MILLNIKTLKVSQGTQLNNIEDRIRGLSIINQIKQYESLRIQASQVIQDHNFADIEHYQEKVHLKIKYWSHSIV